MGVGCTKPSDKNKDSLQECTIFVYHIIDNRSHFDFKKVVGKGGFGRVWKVVEKKTRKYYALKVMDKAKIITKKSVGSVLNER